MEVHANALHVCLFVAPIGFGCPHVQLLLANQSSLTRTLDQQPGRAIDSYPGQSQITLLHLQVFNLLMNLL